MQKPDRSSYTSLDFATWRDDQTLVITPRFQRRAVWTIPARSYFIDTLLQGLPVPPIYLRVRQSDDKRRTIREVVDGQQRITALLEYMAGHYKLSRSLDATYAGKQFSQLTAKEQDAIRSYSFICEVMHGASDAEVLSIFARLNTYSVKLNDQELRNGQWFGKFKTSAYRLAHEHIELWRRLGVFSDQQIARMLEVEFASELMVATIDGMQDKKKSLDGYYEEYDESFQQQSRVERRVRECLGYANDVLGEGRVDSEFHRPALFYTLFCAIYHRTFGLPEFDSRTPKRWRKNDEERMTSAVLKLSNVLSCIKSGEPVAKKYDSFVIAAGRQTDNIRPRMTRLRAVYSEAYS